MRSRGLCAILTESHIPVCHDPMTASILLEEAGRCVSNFNVRTGCTWSNVPIF